jgi:F-type H+-transporting ATPase subunit b
MTIWLRLKRMVPVALLALLLVGFAGMAYAQGRPEGGQQSAPQSQSAAANKGVEDENEAYRHSAMVQKLGGMMGMKTETAATAFEVFNFAILALALGWFLLKTLPKTFRNRTSAIQKHLVDARTATEEANARLSSVEDRLAHLDGQIAEMRAQAERDGALEEQRLRAAVEEEKANILAAADQEIASASLLAQRELQRYAAELAIEQAGRRLVVSAETDRLLVQSFARRLTGDETKGGQN